MNPVHFLHANSVYAKDQPEYIPLPCHKDEHGTITIKWKLSWKERWAVLKNGVIWHQVDTFNRPLQPVNMQVDEPEIEIKTMMFDKES